MVTARSCRRGQLKRPPEGTKIKTRPIFKNLATAMAAAATAAVVAASTDEVPPPGVILWSGAALLARRADMTTPATVTARRSLLALADAALLVPADPVTGKKLVPPSGDIHDYWSVASYDWPCNTGCNRTLWSDCSRWCMPPFTLPFLGPKCVDAHVACNQTTGLPWVTHDGYPRGADKTGKYLHGDRPRADAGACPEPIGAPATAARSNCSLLPTTCSRRRGCHFAGITPFPSTFYLKRRILKGERSAAK